MFPKNELVRRSYAKEKSLFRTLFDELYIDRFPERKQADNPSCESARIEPQRPIRHPKKHLKPAY
jgi:hypothetical protein